MKKKKLNLTELKIKSFITDMDNEKGQTIKGGRHGSFIICPPRTDPRVCVSHISNCLCPATHVKLNCPPKPAPTPGTTV